MIAYSRVEGLVWKETGEHIIDGVDRIELFGSGLIPHIVRR